ncbi:CopL family metal-binding regulatory protein [Denitratimonas tolerans]|jgi:hypothetical protein|uniref:CopL family metal-binding regulatory protein n=1 Tax=Denitratimonas tolerans TaxID=1338420 RepID=A0AAW9R7T8_9GAMM
MTFRALLMRLFLIVALLANGPGIAGASMHMEHLRDFAGHVTYVTAAPTAAEAMAACHEAAAAAPVADDHHHPQATDEAGAVSPWDDCCETDSCCACMHHCFAALVGSTLGNVSVLYRQTAEPFLSLHASAALTNLFRPPIG